MVEELKDFIEEVELPNWEVVFGEPLTLDDYHKKLLPKLREYRISKNIGGPWNSRLSKTMKNLIRDNGIWGIKVLSDNTFFSFYPKLGDEHSWVDRHFNLVEVKEEEFFNLRK
jgi:hypothetical protein